MNLETCTALNDYVEVAKENNEIENTHNIVVEEQEDKEITIIEATNYDSIEAQVIENERNGKSLFLNTEEKNTEENEINDLNSKLVKVDEDNNSTSNKLVEEKDLLETLLLRYAPTNKTFMKEKLKDIMEKNYDSFGGESLILKKKLSKLEQDIQKAKENKENKENSSLEVNKGNLLNKKHEINNGKLASLGECFVKKKSRLEIEKELFAKQLLEKQQKHQVNKQSICSQQVFKLDNNIIHDKGETDNINEDGKFNKNNTSKFTEKAFTCQLCQIEGNLGKGKQFPKCQHYYHNKCLLSLKVLERSTCQVCKITKKPEEAIVN